MKKLYTAPRVELFRLKRLSSMLAHFSADATFEDFIESDPEDVDMLGPGY